MINFKITSQVGGNLSLDGSQDKSLLLSPGEMIKAEVLDVLPSGSVSLRIKGEVITAKTAVPLQQGETAYFTVSDSSASGNELRLRFAGYADTAPQQQQQQQSAIPLKDFMASPEGRTLAGLIQELSDSLTGQRQTSSSKNQGAAPSPAENENSAQSSTGEYPAGGPAEKLGNQGNPAVLVQADNAAKGGGMPEQGATVVRVIQQQQAEGQDNTANTGQVNVAAARNGQPDTFPLNKVESLLKALPADINSLPKEIKTQLQDLLLTSLRTTGQSIQSRLATVSAQISDVLKNSPAAENFKTDTMLNMEGLLSAPLKNALLNTGVALEAKLKSAAVQMQFEEETTAPSATQETLSQSTSGVSGITDLLKGAVQIVMPEDAGNKGQGLTLSIEGADDKAQGITQGVVTKTQAEPIAGEKLSSAQNQSKVPDIQSRTHGDLPALRNDLKAVLLELKQRLPDLSENRLSPQDTKTLSAATETARTAVIKELQGKVEGLLKDIETFQALSKTTDSFYTFLPVDWKALKDGDVSFKRGQAGAGGGSSASCRINLDLANLGNLSILVLMHNNDFFVSFKAAKPDTDFMINANLDDLKSSFRESGLSLKAAHMLDNADTSMERIQGLGASESAISIKA